MARPVYQAYLFRSTEQDPVVDKVRTAWRDAGSPSFQEVKENGGPSVGCQKGWFVGRKHKGRKKYTLRPQHTTLAAFLGGIDKEFFIRDKKR